jgi:selenocysteine-specific translation elongation factor
MKHVMVTLLGPVDWTRSIGKETSSTSFGVGALKKDDMIVTTVYPSKYPEKIRSLLFALSLSDRVYLNIKTVDRHLGETIIALDLIGKKNGLIHVDPLVDRSMLDSIIKGTVVEGYSDFDPEPSTFREDLLGSEPMDHSGPINLMIDQAFNVKGVGCVALGFVTSGMIVKHQELLTRPWMKRTIIRSIQIHDRDQSEAPAGARVGLALKNIEPDDLPRGALLAPEDVEVEAVDSIKGRFRISSLWKDDISEGSRFHLWNSLQFVPVQLRNVRTIMEGQERYLECDLDLETRGWLQKGDRFGLAFLDSKSFRLFAAGESI